MIMVCLLLKFVAVHNGIGKKDLVETILYYICT